MKLVVQPEKCTGCRLCEQICAIHHFGQTNTKLAAIRIVGEFPALIHYPHCLCKQRGACIEACTTGAIIERDGAIHVEVTECIACWQCVDVCPQEAIFVHETIEYPIICNLCFECTEVCNTQALTRSA